MFASGSSISTVRDTPTRKRGPLKGTFSAYQYDEKKRVESSTRSGGEVNATTIT